MIKVNVILNNIIWKKYLKNPYSFIDKKIELINKKNKSTDVLSFPFYEKKQLNNKIKKEKEIYLGDIIINLNEIKNKNNKTKFLKELNKLWVHGLVHLFGYRHKKDNDFYVMKKIEQKYLKYIN